MTTEREFREAVERQDDMIEIEGAFADKIFKMKCTGEPAKTVSKTINLTTMLGITLAVSALPMLILGGRRTADPNNQIPTFPTPLGIKGISNINSGNVLTSEIGIGSGLIGLDPREEYLIRDYEVDSNWMQNYQIKEVSDNKVILQRKRV